MDDRDFFPYAVIAAIFFALGASMFSCFTIEYYRKKAIQHNAAHYDVKTGEFRWNENE